MAPASCLPYQLPSDAHSTAYLLSIPATGRSDRCRLLRMERETGFEPATNSLEGCDSTPELLPLGPERTCDRPAEIRSSVPRWWGEEDSNLRRLRRQIYSLLPLATWVSPHKVPAAVFHRAGTARRF